MKRFILFILLLALMVITVPGLKPSHAAQEDSVIFKIGSNKYQLGDQLKEMDAKPFIEDGRTYVPVRYMSEPFGITVDWNGMLRLVTLSRDDTKVYLVVGLKKILVIQNGEDSAAVVAKKIISEGSTLDVAPTIRDQRTYLPARWVAEAFDYQVEWDSKNQTVAIVPKGAQTPDIILPEEDTPFKRPDIKYPEKPRAAVMGFMPDSKKVVFWNYSPGDRHPYTIDGGPMRRWEETLPDYLTPEPVDKFDIGPVNIKVLLTAFGAPEEAFQYDKESKTLRIYAEESEINPGYVELKEGNSFAKLVWEKSGHIIEDDLNGKFYIKDSRYMVERGSPVILLSAFNFSATSSYSPPQPQYENLYNVHFNPI